jgi:hypothetical protein
MSEGRADENAPLAPDDALPPHEIVTPPAELADPVAAEPPPESSRRSGVAAILGACLALVVVLVLAAPYWAPAIVPLLPWGGSPPAVSEQPGPALGDLDRRVAALEQRPAAASPPAPTVDLAPLQNQLAQQQQSLQALEERVGALATNVDQRPAGDPAAVQQLQATTGKLGAAVADLDARLGKISASEAGDSRADQALVLGLGQLRQSLLGSAPFTADLAAVTALAHDRPEVAAALAPLATDAARGIPSLAILQQRFAARAGAIANAGTSPPPAANDWGGIALAKLRGLVTMRRVGSAAIVNGGPPAAVATAEQALAAGDLAGAVAALATLSGDAAAAAKPWLDDANRRLTAEAALDKASGLVTARLGHPAPDAAAGPRPDAAAESR